MDASQDEVVIMNCKITDERDKTRKGKARQGKAVRHC